MTVIDITVDNEPKTLYMDNNLYSQLQTKIIPNIHKKDKDWVCVIDGAEGSGKSVFAMQLAKVLDPDFCIDRMTMTPEEFTKAIVKATKGQCVVFDEAFTGLSSRSSLSEVNNLLVSLMMEMRQKNLFVLVLMPTFFQLDRYVALWRAKGLFHTYTKDGKRGRWIYFNQKKKKMLYLLGKKTYSYAKPKTTFRGRFQDQYTINEKSYRTKKGAALHRKSRLTRAETYIKHRNQLITMLYDILGYTQTEISLLCQQTGLKLAQNTISDIIKAKDIGQGHIKP